MHTTHPRTWWSVITCLCTHTRIHGSRKSYRGTPEAQAHVCALTHMHRCGHACNSTRSCHVVAHRHARPCWYSRPFFTCTQSHMDMHATSHMCSGTPLPPATVRVTLACTTACTDEHEPSHPGAVTGTYMCTIAGTHVGCLRVHTHCTVPCTVTCTNAHDHIQGDRHACELLTGAHLPHCPVHGHVHERARPRSR